MTPTHSEAEVLAACRVLFGSEVQLNRDFLHYLQLSGAKSAFRRRAKETHPDLDAGRGQRGRVGQPEPFRSVSRAYDVVCLFLRQREEGLYRDHLRSPPERRAPAQNRRPPHGAYQGTVPSRPLEIGRYLYYRGIVPYSALAEALVWQRGQRPAIGRIAHKWGWLTEAAVTRILGTAGPRGKFGERAVDLGLLTPFQVRTLLSHQRSQQRRLGQFFIDRGYLSAQEMDGLVADLYRHNSRILSTPTSDRQGMRSWL